jgi:hypothetical protein
MSPTYVESANAETIMFNGVDIQHSLGERNRSVLQFFGHVRAGVWTDKTPDWAGNANKTGQAGARPATTVAAQN